MTTSFKNRTKRGLAQDLRIVAQGLDTNSVVVSGHDFIESTDVRISGTPEEYAAKALREMARKLEHGGDL